MDYNTSRNSRTKGSWRKTKAGKLEYRFMYLDEYFVKKQKAVSGNTEEECLKKADVWVRKMEKLREGKDPEEITLVELLERKYKLDYDLNYTGEQGYGRNLEILKHLRKTRLGNTPLNEIRKEQIVAYLRTLPKYSDSTITKFYRQLKKGFRIAMEKGLIDKNPMDDSELRCPRSSKKCKEVHALTIDEQKRLETYLARKKYRFGSNDYRLQIMISLHSGMRMGEVNALHPSDIDLENGVIHVRHTVSIGLDSRAFIKDGTKTPAGIRDIPISDALRPVLEQALDQYTENDLGLLFFDFSKNEPIITNSVNSYFNRLCYKLKMPYYGQHCLRHTFATRCIESGVKPVVLKNWLGHRDIHTTLDTYTDVFNNLHDDSLGALNMYMRSI